MYELPEHRNFCFCFVLSYVNKGPSDNRTAAPLALPNKRAVVFAAKISTECAFKVSCPMADCLISASSVLQNTNKKKKKRVCE